MKTYQWKFASIEKKVNADAAISQIQKAETIFGKITPENVLKIAEDENSAIHCLFEWNDARAAHSHRVQQARLIINNIEVKIITNNEPVIIDVYEIVNSGKGKEYKHVGAMTYDDRKYVIETTRSAISQLKNKIIAYSDLGKVVLHLTAAEEELNVN